MFDELAPIKQNRLGLQLCEIDIRELNFINSAPCDIYTYENFIFQVIISKGEKIQKKFIKESLENNNSILFVYQDHYFNLLKNKQDQLIKNTRSLSMGHILKNTSVLLHLITLHYHHVYKHPFDDQALKLQHQTLKNLSKFLLSNLKIIPTLFKDFLNKNYKYHLSQPLLSSMILLAFLKTCYQFKNEDIESLFLVNFFKDLGMSFIEDEKLTKKDLSQKDLIEIKSHPEMSYNLLKNRLPFSENQLEIILNHHNTPLSTFAYSSDEGISDTNTLLGVETVFVNLIDSLVAMISLRPYRSRISLFEALEIIKDDMRKEYPNEFKHLVQFLKSFFRK